MFIFPGVLKYVIVVKLPPSKLNLACFNLAEQKFFEGTQGKIDEEVSVKREIHLNYWL